jgi:hypothetical protein
MPLDAQKLGSAGVEASEGECPSSPSLVPIAALRVMM